MPGVERRRGRLGVRARLGLGARLAELSHDLLDEELAAQAVVRVDLVRVLGPIPELARIWRLLTTPELRHTPRVAALFDFLVDAVTQWQSSSRW